MSSPVLGRRQVLTGLAALGAGLGGLSPAAAQVFTFPTPSYYAPSAVIAWNRAANAAIAATFEQAPIAARALAMLNEAIYNAWAAYDPFALFSINGMAKRPFWEWSDTTRRIALSYAAWRVLVDIFPSQKAQFDAVLAQQAPSSQANNYWISGPAAVGVGNAAGRAMLAARANDGANQYGNLAPGAYADWTGYVPVNRHNQLNDPDQWQPLWVTTAQGVTGEQGYLTPHWGRVRGFALSSGSQFRPAFAPLRPTWGEMQELINLSANHTERTKAQVDFWAANPGSVSPPGQWIQICEVVARNDRNSLSADVVQFFAVSQALLDASIAAWDAKRAYNSVRPITAIRHHFAGQQIYSWGGPDRGAQWIPGETWMPYQRAVRPTPPFPEFVSGHSTFSAAAAAVLTGLRGDGVSVTGKVPAGGIAFETNMPSTDVVFTWSSLAAIAADAGYSRRLGGIHFERGDLAGRSLGRQVGQQALAKANWLVRGGW